MRNGNVACNVESFSRPIRFYSEKKCANCQIDFPDINNDWVSANGRMKDVPNILTNKYKKDQEKRSWFRKGDGNREKIN